MADGPWTTTGDLACPLLSTERELVDGDVLWVDTGISYAGFHSDFGRTWIVGREPNARQRAQFERWRTIMDAVLDVTRAGATAADLTAAAIDAAGGAKPWMPHFYLGHGLGIDSAEMPYVGSDIGEAFDATLVLAAGMVLVLEPIVWDDGARRLPLRGGAPDHRRRLGADDRLPVRPVLMVGSERRTAASPRLSPPLGLPPVRGMTVTEVLPDDAALRIARRARVLAEMEAAGVDILDHRARGATPATSRARPRLWIAGSRPFGPGCVLVRATGAIHLLSTWDEGIPDDIPHENLHGITFNATNVLAVLQGIEGAATARTVATDGLTPRFRAGCCRRRSRRPRSSTARTCCAVLARIKTPEEIDAIRASVRIAERALAAAEAALVPGITERQLTAVFMEAMAAAGVTTPTTQDVAWITSREHPWHRSSRDAPVAAGDLVAFDAGVISGGYVGELGRTSSVAGVAVAGAPLLQRWDELSERLLAACRPGAPATRPPRRVRRRRRRAAADAGGPRPGARRRPPARDRTPCRAWPPSSASSRAWCSR